jgi:L-aspartate oxidase
MIKTDVLIVGAGVAGCYCALNLPPQLKVLMITKADLASSDSMLAQGGICVLKDPSDYDSYFEDTMKAGHYENDKKSVEIMIKSSPDVIRDLIGWGVRFARNIDGSLQYTREGAHSHHRILYHEDITGKEITTHLVDRVLQLENVTVMEHTEMMDLISDGKKCYGAVLRMENGSLEKVEAANVVLATGGIGGLYRHSTNFRSLTGDSLAIALRHHIATEHLNYIQIHPTTFYTDKPEERSFLISESVRGEGAKLYGKDMRRFTNELLPRDLLSEEIHKQMVKDGTDFVWEDLRPVGETVLREHFPNIVEHCREMGYDVFTEPIPVVPAQHYFMGGVKVDHEGRTSLRQLYAAGETACNGVHGKNRLASNSLLESLVWAKRAAMCIALDAEAASDPEFVANYDVRDLRNETLRSEENIQLVRDAIRRDNGGSEMPIEYRQIDSGLSRAV